MVGDKWYYADIEFDRSSEYDTFMAVYDHLEFPPLNNKILTVNKIDFFKSIYHVNRITGKMYAFYTSFNEATDFDAVRSLIFKPRNDTYGTKCCNHWDNSFDNFTTRITDGYAAVSNNPIVLKSARDKFKHIGHTLVLFSWVNR